MSDGKGKLKKFSQNTEEKIRYLSSETDIKRLDRGWCSYIQTIVPKELEIRLKTTESTKHTIRT